MRYLILLLLLFPFEIFASDPRPLIMVIGENSSMPIRGEEPWTRLLSEKHPEWKLVNRSDWNRVIVADVEIPGKKKSKVYPGLLPQLEQTLGNLEPDLILIVLGINDLRSGVRAQQSLAKTGRGLGELLDALKKDPRSAAAALAVVTPPSVFEAKLDQWSKEPFAQAEQHSATLAESFRKEASQRGVAIIDAHGFTVQQREQGQEIMNSGWMIRYGMVDRFGTWMTEAIESIGPKAKDAKAFSNWLALHEAKGRIDELLFATGGGEPLTSKLDPVIVEQKAVEEPPQPNEKKKKKKKKKK